MLKKFTNKKGFTLMEMLIVVAIIAILIAVAIPTFNNALNKAKVGTDTANIRSGYAAAKVETLTGDVAADTKYALQADGSVVAGETGDYKTKGDTGTTTTTIGDGPAFSWKANQTVIYTVKADGKIEVSIK